MWQQRSGRETDRQTYENITLSITSLFGSLRYIYHTSKYIFDNKTVAKANCEVQKCLHIIEDLFKQLEYISQLHNGLKCNPDIIETSQNDDSMNVEISNLGEDAIINVGLETIISQYYHTESLIDGLWSDLERTESYIDEMILWKVSCSHRPPARNAA
ncbi:5355_t:CDS:2 [Scutellospora calospora]|uniref:5355_t:CDS:1 n=1 Tax=Scutellospora calospora TaxID=85575 RepID=A0ACA9JZK9_9GLOM|nr:5355_t:CDS:2 [Scutellospora calospora]